MNTNNNSGNCGKGCKDNCKQGTCKNRIREVNKLNYVSRQIKLGSHDSSSTVPYIEWKHIQGDQSLVNVTGFNNDVFIEEEIPNWEQILIDKTIF